MELDLNKTQKYLESRGLSEVLLARKLDLDYSYVYRVMRGERGVGKKFLVGLIKLCEKEGLDLKSFLIFD